MPPNYTILEKVGEGGMGVVYRAVQRDLERSVALKVLKPEPGKEASVVRRFRREVEVCSSLAHPNVVRIFDFGTMEDGRLFYTMELLDARDLGSVARSGGPLPLERGICYLEQAAQALAYLHERGVIHRDIKPSNMMVDARDHLTLMDFGLVKMSDWTILTQQGQILGTPRYLSPELMSSQGDSPAQDVYALALSFWELFSGQRAFDSGNLAQLARDITEHGVKPLREVQPDVPAWLSDLIGSCLAKDPGSRMSAPELRDALARREPSSPSLPRLAPPKDARRTGKNPVAAIRSTSRPVPRRRMPGAIALAATGVIIGITAGSVLFLRARQAAREAPDAAAGVQLVVPARGPALLGWKTPASCVGRVCVTRVGEAQAAGRVLAEDRPADSHSVAIGPLAPHADYRLEILGGSGAVLWSQIAPAPGEGGLQLSALGRERQGLEVRVPVRNARTGRLVIGGSAGQTAQITSTRREGSSLVFELVFGYSALGPGSCVEVQESPGLSLRFPIPTLEEAGARLASAVDGVPVESLLRTLTSDRHFDSTLDTPLRVWAATLIPGAHNYRVRVQQRREKTPDGYWKERARALLAEKGALGAIEAFRPWAREFFGSREIPIERRIGVYERLLRLEDLDTFIGSQLDGQLLGIRELYASFVTFVHALDTTPSPATPGQIEIFKGPLGWTVKPVDDLNGFRNFLQTDSGMIFRQVFGRDDVSRPAQARELYRSDRSFPPFTVPARARRGRATLGIELANLRSDAWLELTFASEGRNAFQLLMSHPAIEPWHMAMALFPPDRPGSDPTVLGMVRWGRLEASFPAECLPAGPTSLTVRMKRIQRGLTATQEDLHLAIYIRQITLSF